MKKLFSAFAIIIAATACTPAGQTMQCECCKKMMEEGECCCKGKMAKESKGECMKCLKKKAKLIKSSDRAEESPGHH